jgi:hypothetical protein
VALVRELRAFGVDEAAPQLIAMVALVDATEAWDQLCEDVLRKHCHEPDSA